MTLQEVINRVDGIKPNAFTDAQKAEWVNEVEGMVQTEVFLLSIEDCYKVVLWDNKTTVGLSFPDDATMVSPVPLLLQQGDKVKITGLVTYSGNNSNNTRTVLSVDADHMTYTFADNTFSATGTAGDTGEATVAVDKRNTDLLVYNPHDKIYWTYLAAMIDFANGEYDKYNNTLAIFNQFFGEFMRWYAQTYRPADTLRIGGI